MLLKVSRAAFIIMAAAICFSCAGAGGSVRSAQGRPGFAYASGEDDENSFSVAIVCEGDIIRVSAAYGDSVEDVLAQGGITAGKNDVISQPLYGPVSPGDAIRVDRYIKADFNEDEIIPFETETIATSLIEPGVSMTVSEGEDGIYRRIYEREMLGNKLLEEIFKSEGEYKSPVNRRILVGETGAPVSDLDFEWETDENGLPIVYENLLTGASSAGYYAAPGAGTASGLPAMVGHVAVNPNVIPYGSKLFITSADGSFVYGYAIAADTGGALMQGVIDIDLFYASYAESCLNAIRPVDIYILEYPQG